MSDAKPTVLVQLDTDPLPSVFDGVVAVDSGVDHLFRHGGITPANVRDLVYGALFTRGPVDLHRTALFVGGSDVLEAEAVLEAIKQTFFGPFRVSVLLDANGSNTTAAAAVLAALTSVGGSLQGAEAVVLPATGPVGQRVARLLGRLGASVTIGSRALERARSLAERLHKTTGGRFEAIASTDANQLDSALSKASVVVCAGPEGTPILPAGLWQERAGLRVVIDLNAVPPLGVEGIEPSDRGNERHGARTWGALGVGALKMKIHKQAIKELFVSNDKILDVEEVLELGRALA